MIMSRGMIPNLVINGKLVVQTSLHVDKYQAEAEFGEEGKRRDLGRRVPRACMRLRVLTGLLCSCIS